MKLAFILRVRICHMLYFMKKGIGQITAMA
ncbi:MAG: hypothetical protein K0R69_1395 [Clostridia bacterium]|jgi:hypothetical protein|nr:hypothetical protein [Clostridia bacterium]